MAIDCVNVTLSPEECYLARFLADERDKHDKRHAVPERLVATWRDPDGLRVSAMGAEIAAAKWLALNPDMNTDPTRILKYDLLYCGMRIDVKWPNSERVSIPAHVGDWCDIYLAVPGRLPMFRIVGWILAKEARSPRFWNETAPSPCWQIAFADLRPPADLIRLYAH